MFLKKYFLVLFVYSFTLCDCFDEEWNLFENRFKSYSREEIFVADATTNLIFNSNFTVDRWKTLTGGGQCYTGGITKDSMLVVLVSTLSEDGTEMMVVPKIFELQVSPSDFEFFHTRTNGKEKIMVVVFVKTNQEFFLYTLDNYRLNIAGNWSLGKDVSYFSFFKIANKNMLFAITKNNFGIHSADIYEFQVDPIQHRFYQSIPLLHSANSSCLSTVDSVFYLSIPQTPLNQLQVYQYSNSFFTTYKNLSAPKINQVVCFENGFKSFIAFNGLEAGIYQITEDGLTRENINSNLAGTEFWLPIPVNTYRDETVLLCQRRLDHETHFSFDVDVVTYNGNRFEEHEDIPCLLFGEKQNGLKCLTEYDPKTGILGSSYIAIADHLSLIVPGTNDTSILFDLHVGIRKVEHPAKKEFNSYLDLKNFLQSMIKNQSNEEALLIEEHQRILNRISEKSSQLKTSDSQLKASLNGNADPKILKLKDDIEEVVKDIENLKKEVDNGSVFIQKKNRYGKMVFNGPVNITEKLKSDRITSSSIGEEKSDYLYDIVRKDQSRPIEGHKTFNDLTVVDINFEVVNGIRSSSFASNNNQETHIDGNLIFKNHVNTENLLTTSELVNEIKINEQWINLNQTIKGPLEFQQLKARNTFKTNMIMNQENQPNLINSHIIFDKYNDDNQYEAIFIPGNVTVKTLNGHDFEVFLRKLCLKSLKCHLPALKVNGVINCQRSAQAGYLNGLKFPENYVRLEETEKILKITGFKNFTNIARGYKVFTETTVNNIDLDKIITQSSEQELSGNIVFNNLEVESVLTVEGNVKGEGLEKFVPNIGLKETRVIKANVHFLNLEVEGNIIIKNNLNGSDVNKYFDDFIFRDEKEVEISGRKTFPEGFTALKNLHINSNMINDIPLDSLIIKDRSQDLQISTISGIIDFDHLYVTGKFDGENIQELHETLIKLSENQTIHSQLVFVENLNVKNITFENISNLHREETSNNSKNNFNEAAEIILDNLEVETLEVDGNIHGSMDQFDLEDLQENYLHYTHDQKISEPYFIHQLTLDHLKSYKINNVKFDPTFSYTKFIDNITDFLSYRNPYIENLLVDGSINVTTINEKNFDNLIKNHVWMKMFQNGPSTFVTIDGDAYFETLQIKNLADADFYEFVSNLVFKNETDVDIKNSIIFENGIKVRKLLETKTLNDVTLENILRKDGEQTLLGSVLIFGNVTVEDDLKVEKMINNVDVGYLSNNLDVKYNLTKIKGEVMFQRLAYIQNLIINGTINGKDFDKIKSKLAYTNDDIDLDKETIFSEMVYINGNFGITNDINGIILSDFVSKMAWITQDSDIQGPIRFARPVECYKFMSVVQELNTQYLFGKELEQQVINGVFINRGLLKGSFDFDNIAINENLNTRFINDYNMDKIIPLKSDQEIENLKLTDVVMSHNTDVGGKVNGVKLMNEFQRTALRNVQQEIPSEVVFLNNVLIEDNLIASKINNKLSSKIVTTNTDQNLTALYSFQTKCWTEGHLLVHGFVNGINLTFWKNYAIPKNLEKSQQIAEKWTVMEDLNLVGPVTGDGIMNGINITKLVNDVREKESYMDQTEKGIFEDYRNLCIDVSYIYKNSKNQIYKFKYFEELQKVSFFNPIHYVKYFEHRAHQYLLINRHENCLSHLMEFRQNGFYPIRDVHTGIINQVEIVKDKEDMFLVTRGEDSGDSVCKIKFSSILWLLKNQDLQLLAHFENQELLQESQVPLTFYGLKHGIVTEFKIEKTRKLTVRRYRTWDITEDNVAFIPRGFKTGLALRTGKKIIYLNRNDPIAEDDFEADTESVIKGSFTAELNFIVPGRVGGDLTVTNVGINGAHKSLLAVASHKKARVEHRLDLIEIYVDPLTGELFDKIPTYRPSYLTSIEFENGETLLAFMEEQKVLQIYEYKGIEGFKHRSSIRLPASQLFLMELPVGDNVTTKKVLGLVNKNGITLLQAVMIGNKVQDDLKCRIE